MGDDVYTHGHHESVLRSHRWRTAENSASYLLPRLRPGLDLLDVGCGPGTITADLSARVAPGRTLGIDTSNEIVTAARADHPAHDDVRLEFAVGDVYALDHKDETFDVVHAHQLLQHLTDPVAALREMARVTRSGGTIAARDSDYRAFSWAPHDARLDRWMTLYQAVARHNGAEPDAGRFLLGWAQAAGLDDVSVSTSTWTFADPPSREWWGSLWAERCEQSAFARQAVEYGFATAAELSEVAQGFRDWASRPDAFFAVLHGEVLATRR
jgi:ubiquinone/menaquinone biosynthesis C-methylase UbiE